MTNIIQKPSDYKAREEALGIGSFIVQAPAGSGKTSLLIKRFLTLLLKVKTPKEVLALTFTNKAAAEMALRIKGILKNQSNDKEFRALKEKLTKHALQNNWDEHYADSLMIMTIDKLALRLIKQTPMLSHTGVNFITDEDPEELYLETIKETINAHADNHELLEFFNYDYQKLTGQLLTLIKKRDQWLPLVSHLIKSKKHIKTSYIKYYSKELERWVDKKIKPIFKDKEIEELENIVNFVANNKKIHQEDKLRSSKNYEFWLFFRDLVLTNNGKSIRKKFDRRNGFEGDEGKENKESLLKIINYNINKINILKDFYNVIYPNNIKDIFPITYPFCLMLVDMIIKLNEKFNMQRIVDFTQVMGNAIEALRATHLPLILDQNISHIMVDEFQDTNETQLNFLELLTENFAGNNQKSFFAVGDPMQSIYRFRKAEVEIFSRVQKNGIGDLRLKTLFLKVNFRSNKSIIDWINSSYSNSFPIASVPDEGSIPFTKCEASSNIQTDGVELTSLVCDADNKIELYNTEALYILNLIKDIRNSNPEATIAVLTRSRGHLDELITLINKHEKTLPIDAIEMSKIISNQTFQDIYSLTKALYDFNNRAEWIAALKSPWCGLTINDLVLLFENNHKSSVWEIINSNDVTSQLNENSLGRLRNFINVIKQNIGYRSRVAHRYFVESVWRQLKGDISMINSQDIENIDLFLNLLDQSSDVLSIDFNKLERLIKNKYTSKTSIEENSIKFLTIQKSKGLEFDYVVIPNLNKSSKNSETDLILYDKNTLSIKNPLNDKNLHSYHDYKERKRLDNEEIRLLYVAITRAKYKCHLIGSFKKEDKPLNPNRGTFMEILWQYTNNNFKEIETLKVSGSYEEFVPKLRRLNDAFFKEKTKDKQQIIINGPSFSYPTDNIDIQRFTGSIVHKYLEIIIIKQLDIDTLLSNKLDYIRSLFTLNKFKLKDINHAINLVKRSLEMLKKSPDGQWIMSKHIDDNSESGYLIQVDDDTNQLIPDRSFIENNIQWIIDYKTPYSPIKNLDMEAKKHCEQLNNYERIFKGNGMPIQKAVYFPPEGKLVKL